METGFALGSPLSRNDANTSMSESVTYDALNRLTATTVNLLPTPLSKSFAYDVIGNQTSGLGRNMTFTSYNKPASITLGSRTINFLDDTDHQRFKQITPEGSTLYIGGFGVLAEVAAPGTSSEKWTEYLSVGNAKVGMRVIQIASETLTTRYFHTDHLGSVSVITDENGVMSSEFILGGPHHQYVRI